MNARILVVDDEPDIRVLLKDILEDEGYVVDVAEHARAANEIRRVADPDLVLLDIWMPDVDGVTLLKQWKSSGNDHCPVVMMSGHGTVETAVEATRYGAIDFVEKPLSMAKLLSTVKSALSSAEETRQDERAWREEPVGNSRIVQALKQRMLDLRESNQTVFFTGDSGSGRRIWAEFLSETQGGMDVFDNRQPLRSLIPLKRNLYIEEVCELDRQQQSALYDSILVTNRDSDFRFIISSRSSYDDLRTNDQVDPRLARMWLDAIVIPSLDEHIEDIPELLEYYVNWYSDHEQLPYRHFNVAAQNLLRNHRWSGDISELKQFIRAILSNSDVEFIELDEIEQTLHALGAEPEIDAANRMQITIDLGMDLREAREAFEREYLSRHLELSGHNMAELARRVGQERTHLYRKLKSLGLQTKKQ
ncbi:MAG: response regulator [Gammaproteobacteria bacterium]|jgi:DNA-binding NtrC family response regulator|nr:response regulator [Gammaproteobacteria bacterium]